MSTAERIARILGDLPAWHPFDTFLDYVVDRVTDRAVNRLREGVPVPPSAPGTCGVLHPDGYRCTRVAGHGTPVYPNSGMHHGCAGKPAWYVLPPPRFMADIEATIATMEAGRNPDECGTWSPDGKARCILLADHLVRDTQGYHRAPGHEPWRGGAASAPAPSAMEAAVRLGLEAVLFADGKEAPDAEERADRAILVSELVPAVCKRLVDAGFLPYPPAAPSTDDDATGFHVAPKRYMAKGRETIDRIRDRAESRATEFLEAAGVDMFLAGRLSIALFAFYCEGAAIKYEDRAGLKGPANEDLDKAKWYRQMRDHVLTGAPDPRTYKAKT